jgi:hypothetical protein
MSDESTGRKYLSEGQVFRMHFSTRSGLNGSLSARRSRGSDRGFTPRDCDDPPATLPCPAEDELVWQDLP